VSDGIPRQLKALERKVDDELDGVHDELQAHDARIVALESARRSDAAQSSRRLDDLESRIRDLRTLIGGRRRRRQGRSKKKPVSSP
jgi:hypothetical protein